MLGITQGGYEAIKTFFTASAIAFVASGIYAQSVATKTFRVSDPAALLEAARGVSGITRHLVAPASLAGAGFAVWLLVASPPRAWVVVGLIGCGLSLLTAAGVHFPAAGRFARLLSDRSPEDAEVQATSRRVLMVSRLELVLLIAVALAIAFKPGA